MRFAPAFAPPAPATGAQPDTASAEINTGTAHLLPRLIRGRQAGPVFLSERRPGPARRPAAQDLCPATGQARLGYDRARILFTRHTGWQLHQLRHSAAPYQLRARHPAAADHGQDPAPEPAHRDAVRPPGCRSRR